MSLMTSALTVSGLVMANIILLLMVGIMIHLTNVVYKFCNIMDAATDEIQELKKGVK